MVGHDRIAREAAGIRPEPELRELAAQRLAAAFDVPRELLPGPVRVRPVDASPAGCAPIDHLDPADPGWTDLGYLGEGGITFATADPEPERLEHRLRTHLNHADPPIALYGPNGDVVGEVTRIEEHGDGLHVQAHLTSGREVHGHVPGRIFTTPGRVTGLHVTPEQATVLEPGPDVKAKHFACSGTNTDPHEPVRWFGCPGCWCCGQPGEWINYRPCTGDAHTGKPETKLDAWGRPVEDPLQ